MPFATAAILRDSPRTRQVTVERHEGQSQKETCSRPFRRLVKAASMPLLANRQSHTPQFGSLLASRTSQTTPERHGGRSQQETRLPSPHRLAKAASMSALGDRQSTTTQFGQMTAEIHEGRLRTEAQDQQQQRSSQFHITRVLPSQTVLADRRSTIADLSEYSFLCSRLYLVLNELPFFY